MQEKGGSDSFRDESNPSKRGRLVPSFWGKASNSAALGLANAIAFFVIESTNYTISSLLSLSPNPTASSHTLTKPPKTSHIQSSQNHRKTT